MGTNLSEGATRRKYELIRTPEEHAAILHPYADGVHGLVTVARRDQGRWLETRLKVPELPWAVRELAGAPEIYLSQNRFKGPRKIAHLWQLDALWVDLDFHKIPAWADKPPESMWELCKGVLEDEGLPRPTLTVATGRGLALVWTHKPIPRPALPRWNACQQRLYQAFKLLGADRGALDAARVLRIVGTQHAKSGQLVRALTPTGDAWEFDALADEILPLTRGELSDLRVQRALRRAQKPQDARKTPQTHFTTASLWEARLSDLQRLLDLRWWGELPPGHRDAWLFLAVNAMSWLAPPEVLMREAWALARQAGGWDEREASARLQAVFKRARMAAQGKTIEWQGHPVDPRYIFRTETIIEQLGITPDEQREMRTLIGAEEKRCRKQLRERKYSDREAYLAQAHERRQQAKALRAEGKSYRTISEALKCSVGEAHRLLNG